MSRVAMSAYNSRLNATRKFLNRLQWMGPDLSRPYFSTILNLVRSFPSIGFAAYTGHSVSWIPWHRLLTALIHMFKWRESVVVVPAMSLEPW